MHYKYKLYHSDFFSLLKMIKITARCEDKRERESNRDLVGGVAVELH